MDKDPVLGDLRLFCCVARRASFATGAREAGVSPTLMSKRIAQLERTLGVTLLRRTTRQVDLTDEGRKVLAWAQRVLDDVDDLREDVARIAVEPEGPVRISSSPRLGREVVAPALSRLKERHPGMDVWLELLDRRVDLIGESFHLDVRVGEVAEPHLIGHLVAQNRRILCAAPAYLARFGAPASLAEVASHRCVLLRDRDEPFGAWRLTGPQGLDSVKPGSTLASNDIDVVVRWAIDGHGIVMSSQWLLAPALASGALVQLLPQWAQDAPLYAVSTVRSAQSAKIRLCVEALRQQMTAHATSTEPRGELPASCQEPAGRSTQSQTDQTLSR